METKTIINSYEDLPESHQIYSFGMYRFANKLMMLPVLIMKHIKTGYVLSAIPIYLLAFLIARIFITTIPYTWLAYGEIILILYLLQLFSTSQMALLKILYPPGARKLLPPGRTQRAVFILLLWVLLIACLIAQIYTQNNYFLIGVFALSILIGVSIVKGVRIDKKDDPQYRMRFIEYLNTHRPLINSPKR